MKTSELIERLQMLQSEHGDLDIAAFADGRLSTNIAVTVGEVRDNPESEYRKAFIIES